MRAAAEKSDGSVSSDNTSKKAAKSRSYAGTLASKSKSHTRCQPLWKSVQADVGARR